MPLSHLANPMDVVRLDLVNPMDVTRLDLGCDGDIAKVGFVTKPASCSAKARSRLW